MTGLGALPLAEQGPSSPDAQWTGISKITGPQWFRLPVLTIGFLGVSVLWSVEMSYASPYLLSLGLSKTWMSLVFLAGPLAGLIVQPLIGVLADNSRSRFGRRRPYMIGGSILCLLTMLLLGYTRPFATIFTRLGTTTNDVLTIWLAVLSIYFIDFSINAVMAVDRALMVDTLPAFEQPSGTAWAARMLAIGSVAGFFIGNIDLVNWIPMFGSEQLGTLTVVASLLLLSTHGLTAYFVKEKVLVSAPMKANTGFMKQLAEIFSNILTLPRVIRQIFIIQLFAWIGWFPVLFYTSIYIGELHKRSTPAPSPSDPTAIRFLEAEATRLGSRALLFNSLLALAANVALPYFVKGAAKKGGRNTMISPLTPRGRGPWWTLGLDLEKFQVHLASLWAASHLIFALCMGATFFISSVGSATFFMTITGFSWAVTQWAPFSLLSEAILSDHGNTADFEEVGSIRVTDTRTWSRSGGAYPDGDERRFLVGDDQDDEEDGDERLRSQPLHGKRESGLERGRQSVMGNPSAQLSRLDVHVSNGDVSGEDEVHDNVSGGGLSAKAGIILGIHNVFIVIPQLIISGLSSIIFAIFEPGISAFHGNAMPPANGTSVSLTKDTLENMTGALLSRRADDLVAKEGVNSVAVVFRIGGISAAIACVLCWRLAKELRHR